MSSAKRKLIIQSVIACALLFAIVFIAGGVVGYLEASGRLSNADGIPLWVIGGFAIAAMAVGLWISLKWMKSIDEAAQEAHKWAWFWGGSSGMAVGGVLVIMASLPQSQALRIPAWYADRTDPAAYAATGAFGMMILMIIGYAIAWGWWWWARR
jgi:hypothetical protein